MSAIQVFVAIQTVGPIGEEAVTMLGCDPEISKAGQFCLDAQKAGNLPADRFEVQRWDQDGWQESFIYVTGNGWTSVDA